MGMAYQGAETIGTGTLYGRWVGNYEFSLSK